MLGNNKKMYSGRVKNRRDYPEGRTSLLIIVKQEDNEAIVPKHVNLCIDTADVNREGINYGCVVGFSALAFHQWRPGLDRFIGDRMTNDKNSPEYKLPKLTDQPNRKLGKIGEWANPSYLSLNGINSDLYLAEGVTPISSLIGFDPDSVGLIEELTQDTVTRLPNPSVFSKTFDYAQQEADRVEALERQAENITLNV